jgi:hypothetical protein
MLFNLTDGSAVVHFLCKGKTPAIGDQQAYELLAAPDASTLQEPARSRDAGHTAVSRSAPR